MNPRYYIAALAALVASGDIFAQQTGNAAPPPGKTREQVLEELKQAQASGNDMPTGFIAYHAPVIKEVPPTPTQTTSKK
ncbi:MAG TPA: DUF4148 domain-containing protein [Burkholderiaceae bacterium]